MKRSTRQDGDDGAFLVLYAIVVVALFLMVAIVIDLGQDRAVRRSTQNLADFAALAAGADLAGVNSSPSVSDPQQACLDAYSAVTRNDAAFQPTTTPCGSLPAAGTCVSAAVPPVTATPEASYGPTSSGGITVTVTYPVDATTISDPRFTSGAGTHDGERCNRMLVLVTKRSTSFFRGIAGASTPTLKAQAVVSGTPSSGGKSVPALLLLDRSNCASLTTSGGGNATYAVVVEAGDATHPGWISADSAGVVGANGNCTTNNNSSGYVVYGTSLPGNNGPSIVANDSSNGTPGVMSLFSLRSGVSGRGGAVYPGGIYPNPKAGDISSRKIVDDKYNNGTLHPSVGDAITTLRATVNASFPTAPPGYTTFSNCSPTSATPVPAGNLYIPCLNFQPGNGVVFPGQSYIFTGKVTVANNQTFALPNASSIYVRGCDPAAVGQNCNGGNNYSVSVAGSMLVNTGNGLTQTACSLRAGPGAGGTTTNWAVLAQMGGPFLVTGHVSLCQTFAYMGDVAPERQDVTSYSGTLYQCTATKPCPTTTGTGSGYVAVTGGSGDADWSAPNQLSTDPTAANPYEDLAFWSESSQDSTIKGQGSSRTEGVFFLPNAHTGFSGQAAQAQPLNAQFIARSLDISGQGNLYMKPNPADSVTAPQPGSYALIR